MKLTIVDKDNVTLFDMAERGVGWSYCFCVRLSAWNLVGPRGRSVQRRSPRDRNKCRIQRDKFAIHTIHSSPETQSKEHGLPLMPALVPAESGLYRVETIAATESNW